MTLILSRLNAKGYHGIFAERYARLISPLHSQGVCLY